MMGQEVRWGFMHAKIWTAKMCDVFSDQQIVISNYYIKAVRFFFPPLLETRKFFLLSSLHE